MDCEHKCPKCGFTCFYDREAHRCATCRHVHSAPLYTPLPLGLHIPGPDPEPSEELEACVVVAEIHALRGFALKYHGYHRAEIDGGLHLEVQFGRQLVDMKSGPSLNATITQSWEEFKGYLRANHIFDAWGLAA